MNNSDSGSIRVVAATVGVDARFQNSAHEDAAAHKMGFDSALVPGPAVASFMTHMLVDAWGEDWLRKGSLVERQRRPVYEAQTLTAKAAPVVRVEDGLSIEMTLENEEGEIVARATGHLPDASPPLPELALFPLRAHLPVAPIIARDGSRPGDLYRTTPFVYSDAIHDDYLARVRETLSIHVRDRVVHPGYLVKLTMHDAVASYARPAPGVHVAMAVQHFGIAHVGDTLSSSGQITDVYERNGRQYIEAEQLVVANGVRPIAMVHRTGIASFGDKR